LADENNPISCVNVLSGAATSATAVEAHAGPGFTPDSSKSLLDRRGRYLDGDAAGPHPKAVTVVGALKSGLENLSAGGARTQEAWAEGTHGNV